MPTESKKSKATAAPKKKSASPARTSASKSGAKPAGGGRKKVTAKAPRPTSPKPPAAGAVTLEQAKAIIAARAPMRGAAPAGKGIGPAPTEPSLGDVARERKQLKLAQRREQKQRIQDYKAVMQVMKQRGVKGLAPAPKGAGQGTTAARAPTAGGPLRVLAEGDSWFDYPVPFFGGGIVVRLEKLLGLPILNMAKAGDEVRYMMGVEERKQMTKQLRDGSPSGGAWDVLLFSGGGNDIVSNPMALWVRDFAAGQPPESLIHRPRYDAALAIVRAGYEDLIAMRDALSPKTQLVFHAYDFAMPDGRGICHLGPWLKPTFDLRGFPSQQAGFEVVKLMLSDLAKVLASLETAHSKVSFINGQGTLAPERDNWHNELHPSRKGFEKFAVLFHERLKALFPNRVPSNLDH
jgi:hypothetical protein